MINCQNFVGAMALVDIKQNKFHTWTALTIENVYSANMFSDVTLVTADDQLVQAHRIVLSYSSEFFEAIFTKHNQQNPIIYLSGVYHGVLKNILDFVYLGKTQVESCQLELFLETARSLKIKGLADNNPVDSYEVTEDKNACIDQLDLPEAMEDGQLMKNENIEESEFNKFVRTSVQIKDDSKEETLGEYSDIQNVSKTEFNHSNKEESATNSDIKLVNQVLKEPKPNQKSINKSDIDIEIKPWVNSSQTLSTKEKTHICNMCDYRIHRPDLLRVHMNSKHNVEKFTCPAPNCVKVYSSKQNLRGHMKSNHDCNLCDHIAASNSDLKMHKMAKHNIF